MADQVQKQEPPSHVRGWSNKTPKLARSWDWRLIGIIFVVVAGIAWMFEYQLRSAIYAWWHSKAVNPSSAQSEEIPPELRDPQRRSYADMKQEEVKVEEKKVEEAKKEEKKKEVKKEKEKDRKPTLQELARDAQIGSAVVVADVLPSPEGEEGGDMVEDVEGDDQVSGGTGPRSGRGSGRGIQKASYDSRGRKVDGDGSEFEAGSDCQVNAGTPIQVQLLTAIDTARPGGQAIGKVIRNVYDTATGTCLAIPAQSTFYGDVEVTSVKGAKAANVVFTSLTRPHPRNDTLSFPMSASDSMGRGGVNGRVNSNLGTNIALTAIATGVELLPLIVAPGGDGAASLGAAALRSFFGNAETPINRAAREQFEKPSTIELDPNREGDRQDALITVILRRHINADPFDSKTTPQRTNANQRRPAR